MGLTQFSSSFLKESAGRFYDIEEQCVRLADLLSDIGNALRVMDIGNISKAVDRRADALLEDASLIRSFASVLDETGDGYNRAEKQVASLFGAGTAKAAKAAPAAVRHGLINHNLVMPEWLDDAVMRYLSGKAAETK